VALFQTDDSVVLFYSNVDSARHWWIQTFECKQAKVPADWDCPLPSDVALTLAGGDEPTILLCDRAEVVRAGYGRTNDHPILFTNKLKKAHEYLSGKGTSPGSIQDGGTQFFEIRDVEGNVIEICDVP
jgi:hypothetical protein